VLQALYAVTGGEQWKRKKGWMSAAPLNDWEGVTVDNTGRVTHLQLSFNYLRGIIRLSCSAATNDGDMTAGNIPAELSQLSSLQWLDLNSNNLSGDHKTLSLMQLLHLMLVI
jgi:hypothetical protein